MVAARCEDRDSRGCQQFGRRIEITLEKLFLGLHRTEHVAVEADEIGFGLPDAFQQQPEDRILGVNVVHDPEFSFFFPPVERSGRIGLVFEDVAPVTFAQDYPLVALVAEHALLHDAVTVGRPRSQPLHAYAVQAAYAAFADVRIVIFRPLGGVEMRSVVRSDFDPRCGIDGRRPHDGETVVGDLLQVGPVGNAYRGLCAGNAPDRQGDEYRDQSFHFVSAFESQFTKLRIFP